MKFRPSPHVLSITLLVCGAILVSLFWDIRNLSEEFVQDSEGSERPIVRVLQEFWIAFGIYALVWLAVGGFSRGRDLGVQPVNWVNVLLVIGFGVAFRCIMLPSTPIQEIDLYRYIWDGAVVANKLDPYCFGPESVLNAVQDSTLQTERIGLEKYTEIVAQRPGLRRVLDITHFGKYTSPYPPTSQLFFAASVSLVPKQGSAENYVVAMKTMLVVFDILTGIAVAFLLFHVGMNPELSLGYLWCPLVIKEFANGGHLDSIATFFTVVAVYFAARAAWNRIEITNGKQIDFNSPQYFVPTRSIFFAIISSISLAAAVAAKVFPIVLIPIWFMILLRRTGILAVFAVALFAGATFLFLYPMLQHLEVAKKLNLVSDTEISAAAESDASGIEAFSKYWEMNDFLFMLAVENLKPAGEPAVDFEKTPWFRFTSDEFRNQAIANAKPMFVGDQSETNYQPRHIAFFLTRTATILIFGLIVIWSCVSVILNPTPRRWLELTFLTLAWFWLLSPTQNPWYWTWAIPFLAFARGRAWFLMSGVLFVYYLRFWIEYHFSDIDVVQFIRIRYGDVALFDWMFPFSQTFHYKGTTFYDFYVPILEFGPLLAMLFFGWVVSAITGKKADAN